MRFTKKQTQDLRSRDLRKFYFGRKMYFVAGLVLGLIGGAGASHLLSLYSVVLLPR